MPKPFGFSQEKAHADRLACGRSVAEQIGDIEKHGNHGTSAVLRAGTLAANSVYKPRQTASIGVFLGCYRPFTTPGLVKDALKLLDLLGADYTFYDREYCCGLPLVMADSGVDADPLAPSRRFGALNQELAAASGATTMAYCCVGCAYTARGVLAEAPQKQSFIMDVILDHLGARSFNARPGTIAYFEGCHSFYEATYPDVGFDWSRYREVLDRIPGLEVSDLPKSLCCKRAADKLIEKALASGADEVLCACAGCSVALRTAGVGKIKVRTLPELLLESLIAS